MIRDVGHIIIVFNIIIDYEPDFVLEILSPILCTNVWNDCLIDSIPITKITLNIFQPLRLMSQT